MRCTMGRAKAAGACTSRMLTATGYALLTCVYQNTTVSGLNRNHFAHAGHPRTFREWPLGEARRLMYYMLSHTACQFYIR